MMENEDETERIERYLKGTLLPDERRQMEEALEIDPVLAAETELVKTAIFVARSQARLDLKSQLKAYSSGAKAEVGDKSRYLYWTIAAAAMLVLAIGIFIWNQPGRNEQIFAANYKPYPNMVAVQTRGTSNDERYGPAFRAYEYKDYGGAEKLLQAAYSKDTAMYLLLFYRGICQLELGNEAEAVMLFNKVSNYPLSAYKQQAMWYASLAYVRVGNLAEAKQALESLKQSKGVYAAKARKLLGEID